MYVVGGGGWVKFPSILNYLVSSGEMIPIDTKRNKVKPAACSYCCCAVSPTRRAEWETEWKIEKGRSREQLSE